MTDYKFDPKILKNHFDNKIRELCKSCKRYGTKATCPPHIESVEYYRELLPRYSHGILFVEKFKSNSLTNWKELGERSSLKIHNQLTGVRDELFAHGKLSIVFGAGSCKLCKECAFPCRFPDKSIVPIEGTGLNVVDFVKEVADIDVSFPVSKYFYRVGVVLYD